MLLEALVPATSLYVDLNSSWFSWSMLTRNWMDFPILQEIKPRQEIYNPGKIKGWHSSVNEFIIIFLDHVMVDMWQSDTFSPQNLNIGNTTLPRKCMYVLSFVDDVRCANENFKFWGLHIGCSFWRVQTNKDAHYVSVRET